LTRKVSTALLILPLLTLNFLFIGVPVGYAAGPASLYVDPISRTVNNGESFPVAVWVNTGGETVNAVQANLSYPADQLEVTGLDYTGTSFPAQAESTFGGGSIRMGRGVAPASPPTWVTGANLIGTITFKAKVGSGTANVSFAAGSKVMKHPDFTDVLGTTTPGNYSFGSPINPPTVDLRANGTAGSITVDSGANVTLSWTSTDTTSCVASGDWAGSKPTNGSEPMGALTSNKTYVLGCSGPGGDAAKTVQVNVANSPPRPTVSISAKPASIKSGETSTLSWSSTNATGVSITPGIGNVGPSGSKQVKPTASISYTAVASGPGGTSSPASTSITVDNKPAPPPPQPPTDTTACKITDVKVTGVSLKSATIEWKTDELSTGVVEYGLNTKYGFRAESTALAKDHKVALSPKVLTLATIYHYQIKCTDAAGNSGTIKDATFKTKGYVVKVKVTNQETGKAVAGAKVTLASEVMTAKTDKAGIATFEDVTSGEHLITAQAGGSPSDLKIKVKQATNGEIAAGKVEPQTFDIKVSVQKAVWQKYLPLTFGGGLLLVMIVFGLVWWKTHNVFGKKGDGEPEKNEPPKPKPEVKQEAKQEVAGEEAEEFYKSLGPKPEYPPEPKIPPPKPEKPPKMEVFRS